MKVSNKVVVITGAGNGMGREMTFQLLERGAKVFGVDLRADALSETAALTDQNPNFKFHALDITDRVTVAALPAEVEKAFGPADILINNAGMALRRGLDDLTEARGQVDCQGVQVVAHGDVVLSGEVREAGGRGGPRG